MKKAIETDKAPTAIGPYSQSIAAGGFLFISGQLPIDPENGKRIVANVAEKTRLILTNMGHILKEAGADYSNVVKTTIFLKDINDFPVVNGVYEEFFSELPPARSTVQVAALPLGARVEIEAIAVLP